MGQIQNGTLFLQPHCKSYCGTQWVPVLYEMLTSFLNKWRFGVQLRVQPGLPKGTRNFDKTFNEKYQFFFIAF